MKNKRNPDKQGRIFFFFFREDYEKRIRRIIYENSNNFYFKQLIT